MKRNCTTCVLKTKMLTNCALTAQLICTFVFTYNYCWFSFVAAKLIVITYFSLSPNHFETRSAEDTEKNVELLASVATAFARKDLPVPGG